MLCLFLLYSKSDSVIHIYILFHILFHYCLSQDIEYSSLCYTGGPLFLNIDSCWVGKHQKLEGEIDLNLSKPSGVLTKLLFGINP